MSDGSDEPTVRRADRIGRVREGPRGIASHWGDKLTLNPHPRPRPNDAVFPPRRDRPGDILRVVLKREDEIAAQDKALLANVGGGAL